MEIIQKTEQLIGKSIESFNKPYGFSTGIIQYSNASENLKSSDLIIVNQLINEMRNTKLETFLTEEGL